MSATRWCRVCREVLPAGDFRGANQTCLSCVDAAQIAKPWTPAEYERVRQAAIRTSRCWPANVNVVDDETRASLRALVDSLDRRKGAPS